MRQYLRCFSAQRLRQQRGPDLYVIQCRPRNLAVVLLDTLQRYKASDMHSFCRLHLGSLYVYWCCGDVNTANGLQLEINKMVYTRCDITGSQNDVPPEMAPASMLIVPVWGYHQGLAGRLTAAIMAILRLVLTFQQYLMTKPMLWLQLLLLHRTQCTVNILIPQGATTCLPLRFFYIMLDARWGNEIFASAKTPWSLYHKRFRSCLIC